MSEIFARVVLIICILIPILLPVVVGALPVVWLGRHRPVNPVLAGVGVAHLLQAILFLVLACVGFIGVGESGGNVLWGGVGFMAWQILVTGPTFGLAFTAGRYHWFHRWLGRFWSFLTLFAVPPLGFWMLVMHFMNRGSPVYEPPQPTVVYQPVYVSVDSRGHRRVVNPDLLTVDELDELNKFGYG